VCVCLILLCGGQSRVLHFEHMRLLFFII